MKRRHREVTPDFLTARKTSLKRFFTNAKSSPTMPGMMGSNMYRLKKNVPLRRHAFTNSKLRASPFLPLRIHISHASTDAVRPCVRFVYVGVRRAGCGESRCVVMMVLFPYCLFFFHNERSADEVSRLLSLLQKLS